MAILNLPWQLLAFTGNANFLYLFDYGSNQLK
jgi:hypothetical protein